MQPLCIIYIAVWGKNWLPGYAGYRGNKNKQLRLAILISWLPGWLPGWLPNVLNSQI